MRRALLPCLIAIVVAPAALGVPGARAAPPALARQAAVGVAIAVSSGAGSLESASSRAGDTGRKVAFSLIGLALAIAAIVLSFKRDFREAVGVFAVGIVAVLLASPTGVSVLRDTISMLFG
jgi:hypothetical protein